MGIITQCTHVPLISWLTCRYGFVAEDLRKGDSRCALIPKTPLRKVPKLPSALPTKQPTSAGNTQPPTGPPPKPPEEPRNRTPAHSEKARRKEDKRVGKWMKMMKVEKQDEGGNSLEWSWRPELTGKVRSYSCFEKGILSMQLTDRVYKGIPDRWRMAAWWDDVGRED